MDKKNKINFLNVNRLRQAYNDVLETYDKRGFWGTAKGLINIYVKVEPHKVPDYIKAHVKDEMFFAGVTIRDWFIMTKEALVIVDRAATDADKVQTYYFRDYRPDAEFQGDDLLSFVKSPIGKLTLTPKTSNVDGMTHLQLSFWDNEFLDELNAFAMDRAKTKILTSESKQMIEQSEKTNALLETLINMQQKGNEDVNTGKNKSKKGKLQKKLVKCRIELLECRNELLEIKEVMQDTKNLDPQKFIEQWEKFNKVYEKFKELEEKVKKYPDLQGDFSGVKGNLESVIMLGEQQLAMIVEKNMILVYELGEQSRDLGMSIVNMIKEKYNPKKVAELEKGLDDFAKKLSESSDKIDKQNLTNFKELLIELKELLNKYKKSYGNSRGKKQQRQPMEEQLEEAHRMLTTGEKGEKNPSNRQGRGKGPDNSKVYRLP